MVDPDDHQTDQHFCLRWNNFQANITSQFELLRSDEDFTDVTIACDGQKLLAHKVVLSACSPYFKELFKANPCSHPIIFMRDVEARHIISLMEFMYVGEVNVSQAHLSTFLKTAESLKIRGLTDTSSDPDHVVEESGLCLKPQTIRTARSNILVNKNKPNKISQIPFSSTITSSQDVALDVPVLPSVASPVPKRSKSETEIRLRKDDSMTLNPFALQTESRSPIDLMPKMELPDYTSEDDNEQDDESSNFYVKNCGGDLLGNMEMSPQPSSFLAKDLLDPDITSQNFRIRRRRLSDHWMPYNFHSATNPTAYYDTPSRFFEKREPERRNKLVKLGDGIEIYEDQLRSIKWNDYRKLTRGLATILFSPAELATCSVTGQRWSRAGNGERPVKPALDRAKVQAIISYVAARFPMVEISRIKQVLAYKCKENCTALKMKAVRYYGPSDQRND
ncbi:protein tramtrack, beta isoform-like isoform X2 [Anthonomus grandis grandis]|uniref:protein tramtrack, beta isoform-like isoform X2 n=1 Tax=Anthonomus grandis grandis TaxID=2921223 RepID=UPI00216690AB|nr:protein tramtrack, beta isoform-like isoform X2 [Anthonomus grandis grandis]